MTGSPNPLETTSVMSGTGDRKHEDAVAPRAPTTLAESGLSESQVLSLLLKTLYTQGALTGHELAKKVALVDTETFKVTANVEAGENPTRAELHEALAQAAVVEAVDADVDHDSASPASSSSSASRSCRRSRAYASATRSRCPARRPGSRV